MSEKQMKGRMIQYTGGTIPTTGDTTPDNACAAECALHSD